MVQALSSGWQALLRFACWGVIGWTFYRSSRVLAGKITLADIRFSELAELDLTKHMGLSLPWGFLVLALAWGYGERRLRKRHIKRVSSETSRLQRLLDPGRRSSHLSIQGETSPKDL